MQYWVAITTTESQADAQAIADRVIADHLAACVQIVGPIRSVYRWQGKVEVAVEYRCEMKTNDQQIGRLQTLIDQIHPYDVPELVTLPLEYASPAYQRWMSEQLQEK